jgi:hypothetical protein
MSGAALSSAKQRRSVLKDPQGNNIQTTQQQAQAQKQQQPQQQQGPPQVIPISQALTMFDRRINMLEQTVKNLVQQQTTASPLIRADNQSINIEEMLEMKDSIHRLDEMMSNNQDIIEDMHTFATELDNLKNTIIKLQSYTMDVNRMLLENQNQKEKEQGIVIEDSA